MRKNGFTLIELLAVITILSLLSLITTISVANMVKEAKDELSETQINAIKLAAKTWGADNIRLLPTGNACSYITLKDLKDNGLLDSKITDPRNKKTISDDLKIKIRSTLNSKGKSVLTYEVNPDMISECNYIGNAILVDVPQGLTPVVYDGDNWRVPELNEKWYDYDEQMWANAVTLLSGIKKKPGDKVAVDGTEASMMLVWIPRYEYKYTNLGDQYAGGTQEQPGGISINFIPKETTTPSSNDYKIHPAFTFGDKEVSGFWVGKFELSHTTKSQGTSESTEEYTASKLNCTTTSCGETQYLRILPNKPSLRYNNVSNFWYGIKSIENTNSFGLTNIDIHMMKNSEWGAVAYLSQSKYGKYGNSDYTGAQKEIYQNKSSSYITGSSNGTPSQSTSYTQCTYDQKTGTDTNQDQNNCGPGASTTGNIYGVYDMSGGSWEYVMGAYGTDADGIYSGYSTSSNSGFNGKTGYDNGEITDGISLPDEKYYDKYTTSNASTACNNGICYGHSISETSGWYNDYAYMVGANYPWFVRGGGYSSLTIGGVFAHSYYGGRSFSYRSARVVGFGK